ncbi:MAG: cobalamide ABC transporter substrate-binding protein, partial [bacterium (Candidatus Ratteibacteria) CG23_combo_of_CG06-09_8_20_14_all_48_7]
EVSVEKIVSLKPDVVLASSLTNRRAISKLEKLGIKVVSFTQAKDFAEICDQFLSLGKIIGKEKKAEEILVSAKKDADRIKQKVQGLSHPKIFVVLGVKPLFTVTKDSFINDLIEMAGGVNITREARSGCYSREEVVRLNPDIIIITTMGLAGKEEESAWRRFGTLSAVKNNRIYVIDSYLICSPTPVSFVQVLKKMVQIFHPELGQL